MRPGHTHTGFALCLGSALALTVGCIGTSQEEVQIPILVAGTDVSDGATARDAVRVTITRANLAFGPLYLCPGNQAGALCDTARLEWLDSVVIDTTNPEAVDAGELIGISGPVRSWMYDLGISSQLTREDPFVLDAAMELGDASLLLEGAAEAGGQLLPFSASVPVQQTGDTELGIPVIRKSTTDPFSHDVAGDEAGLVVRFDPRSLFVNVDFGAYVEDVACAPDGPEVRCGGSVEQRCAPDGSIATSRDCADEGQVCVAGVGCANEIEIDASSEAFRAIRNGLVSGRRPTFEWL